MPRATPHRTRIEVRLNKLSQLFNSMDSSPFNERDLDADAEEFIVSWAREVPASSAIELVVKLAEAPSHTRSVVLEGAVRHFFKERAAIKHLEFRQLLRQGRISLLIGIVFLSACLALSESEAARAMEQ